MCLCVSVPPPLFLLPAFLPLPPLPRNLPFTGQEREVSSDSLPLVGGLLAGFGVGVSSSCSSGHGA